jgi:hypothetical protein
MPKERAPKEVPLGCAPTQEIGLFATPSKIIPKDKVEVIGDFLVRKAAESSFD